MLAMEASHKPSGTAKVASAAAKTSTWTLSTDELNDDDVALVDEDELLTAEFKTQKTTAKAEACGTSAKPIRKACKNCSCGLADLESGTVAEAPLKSACGSCALGDAFRCSSCPFLGQPPFKSSTDAVKLAL